MSHPNGHGPSHAKTVAIVGSGVVGTATGSGLMAKGHRVVFCDVSPERVTLLRSRGFVTVEGSGLSEVRPDAYLISVPTPMAGDGRVDLSYLEEAALAVGQAMASHPGRPLVVVRSTVPPGTTEDLVGPAVALKSGKEPGPDFSLCMNPEFLRAVSAQEDFLHPRVIVIGALDDSSDRQLRAIYAPWRDVPVLSVSLRTAEATKYVANLFNACKISFFNEMHRALQTIGANPQAAFTAAALGAEGMWNPAYGTTGGSPFGGACLPKDATGFLRFAEDAGMGHLMPLLRATLLVNEDMTAWGSEPEGSAPMEGSLAPAS